MLKSSFLDAEKKWPRCGVPGGSFANRQNSGEFARQAFRHPSCTVIMLFPRCENKPQPDGFLLVASCSYGLASTQQLEELGES